MIYTLALITNFALIPLSYHQNIEDCRNSFVKINDFGNLGIAKNQDLLTIRCLPVTSGLKNYLNSQIESNILQDLK